jgi:uncharacterized protein (DUF924 family)
MAVTAPAEVLEFWFGDRARPLWFEKDAEFDAEIRRRFAATHEAALAGGLESWERAAESCLSLVLVLDQFSRNMHRGTARAFSGDALARAVADRAIGRGFDRAVEFDRRRFFYLPFEHSESLADQRRSVALFRALAEGQTGAWRDQAQEQLHYAVRHLEIIERFGRFPHRNQALERETTPDEAAFLTGPNASF